MTQPNPHESHAPYPPRAYTDPHDGTMPLPRTGGADAVSDFGVVYGSAESTPQPGPASRDIAPVAPRLVGGINPTTFGYNLAVVAALAGTVTGLVALTTMLIYRAITDEDMFAVGSVQSIWFGVAALLLTALAGMLWLWFRSIKGGSDSYYAWITGGTAVASVVIFPLLMVDSPWAVRLITAALILVVCAAMLVAVPALGARAAAATARDFDNHHDLPGPRRW